ncbi:sialate O-acetylesterase [Pedobacter sp. UYP30]|uniref:sialate O-acetylesterase n=1 Tax=Pedobacter sp. UYP30 TaxID=1756400 RepID=UPI003398FE46
MKYFFTPSTFFSLATILFLSLFGKRYSFEKNKPGIKTYTLSMPAIFCDSMILQRNQPLVFWGKCKANLKVTAILNGQYNSTFSDTDGNWKIKLPAMKAGGPYKLKIVDQNKNAISFKDILIGDVWLCAGQSNMNFILAADKNGSSEIASLDNPNIREYRCKMPDGVQNPENREHSKWITAVGKQASNFSAVAYYFAKKIQTTEKIPIGIILMACGDTRAESWMPENVIQNDPELDSLYQYWNSHRNDNSIPFNHRPAEFYSNVVNPIIPFPLKGVVWYQGESNTLPDNSKRPVQQRASEYKFLLTDLIHTWRSNWNNENLPFYIVQLPNYKDPSGDIQWAVIRQAQLNVAKNTKHTGLVVTIDIGDSTNLHPSGKGSVGSRLALWALAKNYRRNLVFSGPTISNMKVSGNKAVLSFDDEASRLVSKSGNLLLGFTIADVSAPNNFVNAEAYIDNDKVIVSNPTIKNPVAVRYAWGDNPKVSLFNAANLPASPFCIKLSNK